MELLSKSVIPITVGTSDGNGFVVGDLFFTAGHVAKEDESIFVKIGDDLHRLYNKDAILLLEEEKNDDGTYNDCAIFKLPKKYNSLTLDYTIPAKGDTLLSISCKHVVEKVESDSARIFSLANKESYSFMSSTASVVDVIGNFISCEMKDPLEEGRSGSPLFYNNNIIGLLHGDEGVDGKKCVFQSMNSIIPRLNLEDCL